MVGSKLGGGVSGCIAVRLFDPRGQPLGYAGRRLDPEQAVIDGKWKFPYGLPRNTLLYGYHRVPRLQKRGVVLVECPWGALRLHQLGLPAVALLGTHMSPRQRALLNEVPRVVLLMDGDEPGRYAKLSHLLESTFDLPVTPGGLCLALQRLGRAAKPTYEALKQSVREAPWVSPDETGWRVGAVSAWLWVYVTNWATVYAVEAGRGFKEAAKILGEDFRGILVRDGWIAYRLFLDALHQTCLAHLLHRCHENLETALGGTARFPHAVKRLLKRALKLRDRLDAGEISEHGLAVAPGKLKAAMKRLLNGRPQEEENRRFAKHLRNEQEALFTFLENPGLPATNHPAEQALRPVVATRKNCGGGHRTWKGARTSVQIATVWRTALQQELNPRRIIVTMLRSPKPTVVQDLLPRIDPPNPARPPPSSPT